VFLLNSRLGLFTAAPSGCYTLPERPFSRSYGAILPSSLTRVIPRTLGFSPRLPVSVCGTGTGFLARRFSWQCEIRDFATEISLGITAWPYEQRICLLFSLTACTAIRQAAHPILLRHAIAQTAARWYWNFHQLSVAYAFRPRLRSRLTLGGRAFPRNP
jgi:hypothetical protein